MQFNSSKTRVVNIQKKSNEDSKCKWRGTGRERECLLFKIKDEKENKYLGIWFSGAKGMFKTNVENAIKKAKRKETPDPYQTVGVATKPG